MGVPAFFRWLSRKYPSIVSHCREVKAKIIDGVKIPVDITTPNPNNVEFDNLYLDMNGIIHPCCHPENKPAPNNEDEMMEAIFEYIDRLVAIVRPRKLLYMAIDGVAPRAKMNQQRSRRFRASKESTESREEIARVKEELRMKGVEVPPDKPAADHFDSNCITPGTEFMFHLAKCLRYYVHVKMNSDPGWSQLMVILSDANVPGEGEHKIMDYIRKQRAQPDHDPNTRHCLCGADADLIMLGLATHEPNFTIIREEFKPHQERPCEVCGQTGHKMTECTGKAKEQEGEFDEKATFAGSEQDFIFLKINVLREYLQKELNMPNLPFKEDFERAIDDWVLMCFFVGNDFLPHLPSLEIREGAIDRLIGLYKKIVYKTGGYLTDSGLLNLERVQLMLIDLGEVENEIFKRRRENEEQYKKRNEERAKRPRLSNESDVPAWIPSGGFAPVPLGHNMVPGNVTGMEIRSERQQSFITSQQQVNVNQKAASELRSSLGFQPKSNEAPNNKRKLSEDGEPVDEVRLWEDGWKDRYYLNKFGVGQEDFNFRSKVAYEYILGISWVLRYYYQGCASWDWYFPYHYAPFASDFEGIANMDVTFPKDTKPFKPLEQLMSVFPAASKKFLPQSWQNLMFQADSKIIDFYPTDFKIDLNGKKYAWQGVALLPFVDECRLLDTLKSVYKNLTEDENNRNSLGSDLLFVHNSHKSFSSLEALYENNAAEMKVHLNPKTTNGVAGLIWCDGNVVLISDTVKSPLPGLEDFQMNQTICAKFQDPQFDKNFIFPAKLLPNAKMPPSTLNSSNYEGGNQRFRSDDGGYSGRHDASVARRMVEGSLDRSVRVPYNMPRRNEGNAYDRHSQQSIRGRERFERPGNFAGPPYQGPPRYEHRYQQGYGPRRPPYHQPSLQPNTYFGRPPQNQNPRYSNPRPHPYSRY